jgi:hypothetical protein
MLVIGNINMWHHPKYYKELRKLRNKLDQAISSESGTPPNERATGPGLKPQASGTKRQATSKPEPVQVQQASSAKRQASQPE